MKHQPPLLRPTFLALFFSLLFYFSKAQTIQPYFFGINAWMSDTIGNASNCTDPPCVLNGKIHNTWQKIKESKTQIVRYGGIAVDRNMPTNFQYIRMIDSIRANGMEPVVQVPYYNGKYTAQQAAAIVQYINVTRSRNIKFWIIGNEPDLKYSATTASQVAGYIKPFASAMKAVDSTIKIIGPETAWFNKTIIDGLTNPGGANDITGTDNNGRYYIDVVSFHTYPMGDNNTTLPNRSQLIAKLTGTNSFESNMAYLNTRLTAANNYHSRTGSNALSGAVTEANVVYANNSADDIYGVGANSFLGAQFVTEIYGLGLKHGFAFINLWSSIEGSNTVQNIGFIDKSTGNRKPLFYHYKLMADHFKGTSISATDNQTNVKVFASKDAQKTTVMVMNQELNTDLLYSVKLNTTAVTGTNSLQINVNAGINVQYSDTLKNQSTVLLQFDGQGNLTRKCVYSLSVHAVGNIAPTCIDYPVIDLMVTSLSVSTVSAMAGASVQVQSTIYNSGSSPANFSKVGYYLSTDSVLSTGDAFVGYAAGSSLQSTTSAQRQASITIPTSLVHGNYYLLAKADYTNEVTEVNENNNVSATTFTILQTPNVDLVIQNPVGTPTNVLAGAVLTLTSSIVNTGSTTAFGGKIGYYISSDTLLDSGDGFMAYSSPATLTPNSSAQKTKTVSIASGMPAGIFYILLVADYANDVTEVNELNNISRVKISISLPAASDLVINAGSISSLTVFPGSSLTLSATIANTGSTNAASSKVGFYLSSDSTFSSGDSFLGFAPGAQLNAGTSALRQSTVTLPSVSAGKYYFLMIADYDLAVNEINETNNVRPMSFNLIAIPSVDLKVTAAAASPTSVLQGGVLSLSCTVLNSGSTTATSGKTGYYLSADTLLDSGDSFMALSPSATLNAGASAVNIKTVAISGNQVAGNYYLLFVSDYAFECSETNELNNIRKLKIQISSPPKFADLVIQSPSLSVTSVIAGKQFVLNATIYNNGNAGASSSKVAYYLSQDTVYQSTDLLLGSSTGGSLAIGTGSLKSFTAKISLNQKGGNYYVLYFADYDYSVTESNESNNVSCKSITVVGKKQDLSLMNMSGTRMMAGSRELETYITLINQGNVALAGSVTYYLSKDKIVDQFDVQVAETAAELEAGEEISLSTNLEIPENTAAGSYYIIAMADNKNQIEETDESNNIQFSQISIGDDVTGLNDFAKPVSFNAYPNPSRGRLVVEATLGEDAMIDVIDLNGNVVLSRVVESSIPMTELDLESLRDGVYIIRVRTEHAVNTKSVILAR